jgi:ribosome maturation factor RimP
MSEDAVLARVRSLVMPIVTDLKLDLYDLEFRGGTLRITLDTPPGTVGNGEDGDHGGINLDTLALATRIISRDFDHHDPVPGHYTLEVTSPGLERTLRLPAHFQREIGKTVAIRLRETVNGLRRVQGVLIAATDDEITVRLDDAELSERTIAYGYIDRARTVFIWGPAPKPGKAPTKRAPKSAGTESKAAGRSASASKNSAKAAQRGSASHTDRQEKMPQQNMEAS